MKRIYATNRESQVEQAHPTAASLLALCQINQEYFQSRGMEFEANVFQESMDWIKEELGDPSLMLRQLRLAAFKAAFSPDDSEICP